MAKIGILVPREEMRTELMDLMGEFSLDVAACRAIHTEDTVNEARAAVEAGAQILIARGYQARIIRRYMSLPLVEIHLTAQEVGLLLQRAREISGKERPRVALVAFANMLPDLTHMAMLMNVDLTVSSIEDAEVVGDLLESFESDRPDVIIGGDYTCAAARERGYLTIFYQSTSEALREALHAAQAISYAMDSEQQNAARFEAVLDTSFNGVVQVNPDQCVISLNRAIEELVHCREADAVGRPIQDILPEVDPQRLQEVLTGGRESVATSIVIDKEAFMILAAPIEFDGRITGAILSLRQISAMSSLSRQAKRDLLRSGYQTATTFRDLASADPNMRATLERAETFALSESPVLLYEREGNEAAMIARAIHNHSNRKSGPFVSLDVRDLLPGEQVDALLHRSDPQDPAKSTGAMVRAHQGTLFLNRIEKLSLQAQHQLLRTLLPWTYMHTDARPIDSLDVRIIACAKENLLPAVEAEAFSEELYYHLSGLALTVPALENRPEDLKSAFRAQIERNASRYRRHVQLTDDGLRAVPRLRWPGGLTQVEAFCERIVLTARRRRIDGQAVQELYSQLYPEVRQVQGEERLVVYEAPQAQQIRDLLEKHGGDRAAVARELGISKTTLWRHMKKYNVAARF